MHNACILQMPELGLSASPPHFIAHLYPCPTNKHSNPRRPWTQEPKLLTSKVTLSQRMAAAHTQLSALTPINRPLARFSSTQGLHAKCQHASVGRHSDTRYVYSSRIANSDQLQATQASASDRLACQHLHEGVALQTPLPRAPGSLCTPIHATTPSIHMPLRKPILQNTRTARLAKDKPANDIIRQVLDECCCMQRPCASS